MIMQDSLTKYLPSKFVHACMHVAAGVASVCAALTVAFSGFEYGITMSGDKIHVLKQHS